MPPTPPYPQTWDLDSLAAHPSSESFRQLMDEYRADLTGLADQADHVRTRRMAEYAAFMGQHAAA